MPQKVIIVGGGVAGLTAAHELVERNFDVTLYERRDHFGGKAASTRLAPSPGQSVGRPAEHGFRFFPHWYKHLPDTMNRIPFRGRGDSGPERTVGDHLVPCDENEMLRYRGAPVPVILRPPRSADQAHALVTFLRQIRDMGLPASEAGFFFQTLATFLEYSESDRRRIYDAVSWWKFVDAEHRTKAFQELAVATTQNLLAARPTQASAYTIATVAVRTLFAQPLARDHCLDGPTSEVWIDPWIQYLTARGVTFRSSYELESIEFEDQRPRIKRLRFSSVRDSLALKWAKHWGRFRRGGAPAPPDAARRFLSGYFGANGDAALSDAVQGFLGRYVPADEVVDQADHYVFALPVEQMAYFVNRSATMLFHDERLKNIVSLARSTEWMAGIQYYLNEAIPRFPAGHVVCADSEWGLTAREQVHLWRNTRMPANVRALLTIDISNWNAPGRFILKEASRCQRTEIATEVWKQLVAHTNRDGDDLLRDSMLLGGSPSDPQSFHLDDDIVELTDRRKQAAYAHAAALRDSAEEILTQSAKEQDAVFAFGDREEINREPLLINRPGTLARRPGAATGIDNMFIAADYVDTRTNLASMESANEAGRLAVNAVLERSRATIEPCRIFEFEDGATLARLTGWASAVEATSAGRRSMQLVGTAADALGVAVGRFNDVMRILRKKP